MLLLETSDQLGNQMFAYASVKTIALDKGYEFRVLPKSMEGELSNDKDEVYGNTIDTIFESVKADVYRVEDGGRRAGGKGAGMPGPVPAPEGMERFQEVTDIHSSSAVCKEALQVKDHTLMAGHYIAAGYFMHRIGQVREWFRFPEQVEKEVEERLSGLKRKHPEKLLVSVHFRVGPDYRQGGYLLDRTYWKRAAEELRSLTDQELLFLVFYDKKDETVTEFMNHFCCVDLRRTLVYDLCTMSRCDAHIVCNSSFSMMTGLLDPEEGTVICPATFPIPEGYLPSDCYPEQWHRIEAGHDGQAYREYERAMGWYRFKQKIKRLIGKR